jgi:hypothetical protein
MVEAYLRAKNKLLGGDGNLVITSTTWTPVPESKVIVHPTLQYGKIKIDVADDDESN